MARIRSIHPSFFTDEAVVSCSPLARLLYVGLWTDADDQGLFEWKPLQIKMRLLPGDNADAPALLAELVDAGLVGEFVTGGKRFGAIRDFRTYQRPKKPNSVHVLPVEWRTYVGLDGEGSEPTDPTTAPNSEPVPHQFPTEGERSPQMEDVGEDVGSKTDAIASSVVVAAPTKPTKAKTRTYSEAFEAAWRAYPHHKGRSSKPNAQTEFDRLPDDERDGMVSAIRRFVPNVGEVCGGKGASDMAVWLKDGKHLNWMTGPTEARPNFDGPPELLASVASAMGDDFAQKWVRPCHWRAQDRTLVARNTFGAKKLTTELAGWLAETKVKVAVVDQAEPPRQEAA